MRETARSEFGTRLREARNKAGLTQQALAKRAGMPLSTLAEAETKGQGSTYTPQLAAACGVSPEWLATGEGEMKPSEWAWPFALLTPEMLLNLSAEELDLVEKYALHLISLKTHGTVLQVGVNTEPAKEGGSTLEFRLKTRRNKHSGASDRAAKPSR